MNQKELQVIVGAAEVFMRYGLKSVTMDDIAKNLGCSKKTLYEVVSDKAQLVLKVMQTYIQKESHEISEILAKHENAIDQMIAISKHVNLTLSSIHPSIHFDLEKYFPEAYRMFLNHKETHIFQVVKDNLELGQRQLLYRENMNAEVLARIYTAKIDILFDADIFPHAKHRFADVYDEFIRYHIRGIASESGIEYLKQKVKSGETSLW